MGGWGGGGVDGWMDGRAWAGCGAHAEKIKSGYKAFLAMGASPMHHVPNKKRCAGSTRPRARRMSEPISAEEFEQYTLCKAYDVISGDGSYKRYVFQCAENEEPWAIQLHASVSRVSGVVRDVHQLVDRVRATASPLARVCTEVVTSMHAPVRLVGGLSACCLTDIQSKGCVDVSRATKSDNPTTVHSKFRYFVLMLYYVHRLEHVVRSMTKAWLTLQEAETPDATMAELTARFAAQRELIGAMHRAFVDGCAHVTASLREFLCHQAV